MVSTRGIRVLTQDAKILEVCVDKVLQANFEPGDQSLNVSFILSQWTDLSNRYCKLDLAALTAF